MTCDDSCEFAFDGVCDDRTTSNHEKYRYYQDDNVDEKNIPLVSACLKGTDCTDCGGVDAIVDYSKAPAPDSGEEVCTNTCGYARDGVCDDPRGANYCKVGTDCQVRLRELPAALTAAVIDSYNVPIGLWTSRSE